MANAIVNYFPAPGVDTPWAIMSPGNANLPVASQLYFGDTDYSGGALTSLGSADVNLSAGLIRNGATGQWVAKAVNYTMFSQSNRVFTWYSGTAVVDANVTPTERLRLDDLGNLGLGGASFGGGARVLFIANASVVPASNPTGGAVLYCEAGALKSRGSGGTITTIAPA